MEKIKEIKGIGESRAADIYDKLDIADDMSREEIREIIATSDIFDTLPIAAKVDIIMNPGRIKWEQIDALNTKLRKKIRGIKWIIAGGYRRNKPESGDIDIVISKGHRTSGLSVWEDFRTAANAISGVFFHEPYASGESKISTLVELGDIICRVDVFLVAPDEWVCALLYATGSGLFNVRMRAQAKRLGYKLNQRHLTKGNKIIDATEREIFDILGMTYLSPEDRLK